MNHYGPSQRQSTGRFDYTCSNRRTGTYPIGYCHSFKEFTPKFIPFSQEECDRLNEKEKPFLSKYHDDGHATADEACACYRVYLLDHETRFHDPPEAPKTLHRCEICNEFTAGMAEVGNSDSWYLCDTHRNRETVEKLFSKVGECWSSY